MDEPYSRLQIPAEAILPFRWQVGEAPHGQCQKRWGELGRYMSWAWTVWCSLEGSGSPESAWLQNPTADSFEKKNICGGWQVRSWLPTIVTFSRSIGVPAHSTQAGCENYIELHYELVMRMRWESEAQLGQVEDINRMRLMHLKIRDMVPTGLRVQGSFQERPAVHGNIVWKCTEWDGNILKHYFKTILPPCFQIAWPLKLP